MPVEKRRRENVSDRLDDYPLYVQVEWRLARSRFLGNVFHHGLWEPRRRWHRLMWRWKKRRRPDSLVHSAARVYSQNDEDGMLLEVFKRIGEGTKYAVEFGISSGDECCTRNLIAHHGWGGLVMDGSEANIVRARQTYAPFPVQVGAHFITLENIVSLFRSYDVPQRHDLLVVDIDGNDYWVLGALLQHYQPRVIVAEYNGRWWPPTEWVMSYRPDHVWDWTCYGGASLTSLNKLCTAYGYRLVGCDPCGVNGFFVHRDELGDRFPDASYGVGYHFVPPAGWHPLRKHA